MLLPTAVALVLGLVGLVNYVYKSIQPPPPKICGSAGGPPVTSPRIKLRDGRYLAYKVQGAPLEKAKHVVVVCHGLHGSKEMDLPFSKALVEELNVCFVIYDRPGFGESDPNPKRGPENDAKDIEELADYLKIGSRMHVIGLSMGAYVAWSCLLNIPHRLAGLTLVAPFVNYYWSGLSQEVVNKCFNRLLLQDQWTARIAHYAPWLFYWFMTQKLFPMLYVVPSDEMFTKRDLEVIAKVKENPNHATNSGTATQQGVFYSIYQDLLAGYGKWEKGPMEVKNPFPNNEGKVHVWQGRDDKIVPVEMNRCIAEKQPWIKYHELKGSGHMFIYYPEVCDDLLMEMLS